MVQKFSTQKKQFWNKVIGIDKAEMMCCSAVSSTFHLSFRDLMGMRDEKQMQEEGSMNENRKNE